MGAADALVPLVAGESASALAAAAEDGFDVVVDPLGGEYLPAAVEATIDVKALQGRTLIGHSSGYVPVPDRREAYARMAAHTLSGELRVAVERFDLGDVASAWARQAQSTHTKVVLTLGGPRP